MAISKYDIYYNTNYDNDADILADEKRQAESIVRVFEQFDTEVYRAISNLDAIIQKHDAILKTCAENIEDQNAKISKLMSNQIWATLLGESFHIEDSADMLAELTIAGNHRQDTSTQGKNVLDIADVQQTTINGVTYSIKDGVATFNGIATAAIDLHFQKYIDLPAGTWVGSRNNIGTATGSFASYITEGTTNLATGSTVFTTTEKKSSIHYRFYINAGSEFTNYQIKPQLESGSTVTVWEQFRPNKPSISYPSEIQAVGGNINIFDKDKVINNLRITRTTGVEVTDNTYSSSDYCMVEPNTDYYINMNFTSSFYGIVYYDKDKKYLSGEKVNNNHKTPENCYFVRFSWLTANYNIDELKLEKGKVATGYSKFGQGSIDLVKCAKNTLPYIEKVNASMASGVDFWGIAYYQKVKPNTKYTLSKGNETDGFQLREFDKDGNVIQTTAKTFKTAFTTSSTTCYIKFRTNALASAITDTNFMLEEGVATAFEQYKGELLSMPTQKRLFKNDYLDFGADEEVHKRTRFYLNGTENWQSNLTADGYRQFYLDVTQMKLVGGTNAGNLCNIATEGTTNIAIGNRFYVNGSSALLVFINPILNGSSIANITDWKNYLANNEVYVDVYLAEEERIAFTEEQKIVAKELQNIRTYKTVTNIYCTDSISPKMELTYIRDNETLFKKAGVI